MTLTREEQIVIRETLIEGVAKINRTFSDAVKGTVICTVDTIDYVMPAGKSAFINLYVQLKMMEDIASTVINIEDAFDNLHKNLPLLTGYKILKQMHRQYDTKVIDRHQAIEDLKAALEIEYGTV